ncbi:hypothetical protein MFIFM68171_04898 [Madurella fahalii]|uniref:Ankyrin repeat protein n=1 Tax=Madurella fahalii TaxID=1157608 RepID=A0ABQ0GA89_9PEZI
MAVDPLTITTSIITLSKTLHQAIHLLSDFGSAEEKVAEIKRNCALTASVLDYLQQQLKSSVPPKLLIDGADRAAADPDVGINLAAILKDNVSQLQLELDVFVVELASLRKPCLTETRIGRLLSNGLVAWKMSYLEAMDHKIVRKRMQLELVLNNLQSHNAERRLSHGSITSALSEFIKRRLSHASDPLPPPSYEAQEKLIKAIKDGNKRELEALLQEVSPNFHFRHGVDELFPLHLAAMGGDSAMVDLLISQNSKVDCCSRTGETPLMLAIKHDHAVVAITLIRRGADILMADGEGQTALHIAARNNMYAVAQVLLRNGADANAYDKAGRTPLMEAVCRGDRDTQPHDTSVLRVLLEPNRQGIAADPILGTPREHYTPLHHAAAQGYLEDVQIMLTATGSRRAMDRLVLDSLQRTPLWFAAKNGHVDVVKLLIRLGADVNHRSRDANDPTPLWAMAASALASSSSLSGVSVLLNAGADPNTRHPGDGHTLLHRACRAGDVTLGALLLQHGADPRLRDVSGMQPIHYAAREGREASVEQLLRCETFRVDVDSADSGGVTPLMLAAEHGHDFLVKSLVEHKPQGADWRHRDRAGCDAFYVACARGHVLCAAYLLGCGADVNMRNEKHNTPLHVAARMGEVETVGWLLRMGADREAKSIVPFDGMTVVGTPADIARAAGPEEEVYKRTAELIDRWDANQRRTIRYTVSRISR